MSGHGIMSDVTDTRTGVRCDGQDVYYVPEFWREVQP